MSALAWSFVLGQFWEVQVFPRVEYGMFFGGSRKSAVPQADWRPSEFVAIEKDLEAIEDLVYEVAEVINEAIQLAVDIARGK